MTINIQLTEKLAIGSDANNWTLTKPVNVKDKDTGAVSVTWNSFNYFGTLQGAVNAACQLLLRTSDAQNAKELVEAAEKINALMTLKLKEIVKSPVVTERG